MTTAYGLPYFFEDSTGIAGGPSDYLDIYDRPPFLRLTSSHTPTLKGGRPTPEVLRDVRVLKVFELGSRFSGARRPGREEGTPSSVITLESSQRAVGAVKFHGSNPIPLDKWLKKSSTFGRYIIPVCYWFQKF